MHRHSSVFVEYPGKQMFFASLLPFWLPLFHHDLRNNRYVSRGFCSHRDTFVCRFSSICEPASARRPVCLQTLVSIAYGLFSGHFGRLVQVPNATLTVQSDSFAFSFEPANAGAI